MTTENKTQFQRQGSASHFLLSKTDTGRSREVNRKEVLDADEALRTAFPDMRCGSDFIEYADQQLEAISQFSALVIGPDQVKKDNDRAELPAGDDGNVDVAGILDGLCRRQSGWWGILEAGLFAGCLPAGNNPDSLEPAREFQSRLGKKTGKTVTIGVASFPTMAYEKCEIINNARKAFDHATFFGANSLVAFDDVSLNISGDKLYEKGDIPAAINEFKLALALDPGNVNVHNSLGVCYGLQSDYDSAIAAFQKAMALDPGEYMALYNLGLVHLLTEQREQALEYFLDADKINGNNFEVAFQTGKLYLETGKFEKSRPYLERAAELQPESGQAYRYLGDCYVTGHMPEAAVPAYKKAIKHNPHDAAALSALGNLFEDQGENPEITLMFLRESVSLSPENGLFHHRLGRHYANQQRLDDALNEYEKANSLGHDAAEDIKAIEDRKKV